MGVATLGKGKVPCQAEVAVDAELDYFLKIRKAKGARHPGAKIKEILLERLPEISMSVEVDQGKWLLEQAYPQICEVVIISRSVEDQFLLIGSE